MLLLALVRTDYHYIGSPQIFPIPVFSFVPKPVDNGVATAHALVAERCKHSSHNDRASQAS